MPTATELLGQDPQLRTAYMLVIAHEEVERHTPKTKARAVAAAEYLGMCKAIDRLRLAHTVTEVEMAVVEALREASEPRPVANISNNTKLNSWHADVARAIARKLNWITIADLN